MVDCDIMESRFTALSPFHAVKAITSATQPQGTVSSLAKGRDFLLHAAFRVVQFRAVMLPVEFSLDFALQVDSHHALQASHPKLTVLGHQTAYASSYLPTALKGVHHPPAAEVVKEKTVVGTYPKTVVDRIVSQGTHKASQSAISLVHGQGRNLSRAIERHIVDSLRPRAYP